MEHWWPVEWLQERERFFHAKFLVQYNIDPGKVRAKGVRDSLGESEA